MRSRGLLIDFLFTLSIAASEAILEQSVRPMYPQILDDEMDYLVIYSASIRNVIRDFCRLGSMLFVCKTYMIYGLLETWVNKSNHSKCADNDVMLCCAYSSCKMGVICF